MTLLRGWHIVATAVYEILALEALDLLACLGHVHVAAEQHATNAFGGIGGGATTATAASRLGQKEEIVFRRIDNAHGRIVALCDILADLYDIGVLGLIGRGCNDGQAAA